MLPFKSAVTLNELNEHELEERLYAILHHVDETEGNLASNHSDGLNIAENALRSTLLRYWRTSEPTTPYQQVNVLKDPAAPSNNNNPGDVNQTNQTPKPKEEKHDSTPKPPSHALSLMLQNPVPQNLQVTIEIIEQDDERAVVLESSDEDEMIEVALPPMPTITIESSDEYEVHIFNPMSPAKTQVNVHKTSGGRDVSSAVSSVSDEFIGGDCIAMDISSRHPYNPNFDFSLHGSDLLGQSTPSKTKKRKRTEETEYFATPKSNAKNRRQKTKLYAVTEKSIPNPDLYDSDSNQSMDTNENRNSYIVTEKSLPSTDVYESDSNWFECAKEIPGQIQNDGVKSSDMSKSNNTTISIDLTGNESFVNLDESDIQESIILGNVSGFTEYEDYGDANLSKDISSFEPRCPRKTCVNCGSPNQMYTSMCRNCCNWGALQCADDTSIIQSPVPHKVKRTIEIIEQDDERAVVLESSDEDEMIEVALPPMPTITVESSDEYEVHFFNPMSPVKTQINVHKTSKSGGRDFSASPAPSAVSSLSDEFISGDCIAMNISSRHPDNPNFDFSLHGSDLLGQSTPSKTKKRKRTEETEYFATSKSNAKNRRQKTKLYALTEKSTPNPDLYDSDSNQSMDTNENRNSYIVTEKSLPSTDVYESDSNWFECAEEIPGQIQNEGVKSSDMSKSNNTTISIDLTGNESFVNLDESDIQESIILGNVSGFTEYEDYGDANLSKDISSFEPRCPRKTCVNCGSPNQMYTSMCRNCCNWGALQCADDTSIMQSPVPHKVKRTIEIIEQDDERTVVLESSDEDEMIEVALPPMPTITVESSDEYEVHFFNPMSPVKTQVNVHKTSKSGGRDFSASPAPSAVSSLSDEFISGDCIAMNISSRHPDNPNFDFSLHGSDLLGQSTPSKTKKRKRTEETEYFATPKSNARNRRQKTKLYAVTEKSIPNPDLYDSDSNQSMDTNENRNSYIVTEKSLPSTDVYESDSNWFECAKEIPGQIQNDGVKSSDMSKSNNTTISIDLTGNESFVNLDESDIQESIILGNVSGFTEYEDYGDANLSKDISSFEPRCPRKTCVNCGSPNQMYTSMCRNCCNWGALQCADDTSIIQSPVPHKVKRTIEIIEQDDERAVVLESSDEDEMIEVALPPMPTITVESSDEYEVHFFNPMSPVKTQVNVHKASKSGGRDFSASPAPSAVSSLSDEFITGDCIAMNISSRHPDNPNFDFSLHGSDLLGQSTPSKTKKRKRTEETEYFATPKSNARNRRQKTKLYALTEKSIPNPDLYDSDSNQSMDTNENRNSYIVTEKSLPSTDVYESDSNWFECAKEIPGQIQNDGVKSSDMSKSNNTTISIDLTGNESFVNLDESDIQESIILGNVSGFTEYEDYGDANLSKDISSFEPRCPRKTCVNSGYIFIHFKM